MSNPFKHTINLIVQARDVPDNVILQDLLGCLANQEDKVDALRCGLIPAIFRLYERARLIDEYYPVRHTLMQMLHSFTLLKLGRQEIFERHSLNITLAPLFDSHPLVREEAIYYIASFCSFIDSRQYMTQHPEIFVTINKLFLEDHQVNVIFAAIFGLKELTRFIPAKVEEQTMKKLVEIIQELAYLTPPVGKKETQTLKAALQAVWNACCDVKQKQAAIEVHVVDAVTPLLESNDEELKRLSAGVLMAITVEEKGKVTVLKSTLLVKQLCHLVLDSVTPVAVHSVVSQVLRNCGENPLSYSIYAEALLQYPDVLISILGEKVMAKIIQPIIQANETSAKIVWAARALHFLLKTEEGRIAAWEMLGIVPRLAQMSCSADKSIKALASRCLTALCQDNEDAQLELHRVHATLPELDEMIFQQLHIGAHNLLPKHTALLLLDCQNEWGKKAGILHSTSGLAPSLVQRTLDNMQAVLAVARSRGCTIVHLPLQLPTMKNLPKDTILQYDPNQQQILELIQKGAFREDTWGAEILEELKEETDLVLTGRRGVSGFRGSALDGVLKSRGINSVALLGFNTQQISMLTTARAALDLNYHTILVHDAVAPLEQDKNKLSNILPHIRALTSEEFINLFPDPNNASTNTNTDAAAASSSSSSSTSV